MLAVPGHPPAGATMVAFPRSGRGFTSFQRGLFIAGSTAGLVLGMGVFTFHTAKGTSYLSNDPRACVNCHVMNEYYDSWQKSSHHAVATCNDCHVPEGFVAKWIAKGEHGWNHSYAFTTQRFHEPIQVKRKSFNDLQGNCLRCHGELVSQIAGRRTLTEDDPLNCLRCHRAVGHQAR